MPLPEREPSRRVTLRDIARRLDVSHATVSRALNEVEDAFISTATRERVRAAAREMGYRPNATARSLATGKTGMLGLWVYALHRQGAYHSAVAHRMTDVALAHGYRMVVDPIRHDAAALDNAIGFDQMQVDGIIAHEAAPALQRFPTPGVAPLVSTGVYHLSDDADAVAIDLEPGARDAMRHLLDAGRRRIVYLTDDLAKRDEGDARYRAYVETLREAGLPMEFVDVPHSRAGAREGIRAHVARHGVPDALFCHNDDFALGAYRGLCDLGVRVPDDVALVGCDGIEELEYLEVPITTVAQPLQAMCEAALRLLTSRIENPSLPVRREVLRAELVVRASTLA